MSDPEQKTPFFPPGVTWLIGSVVRFVTGGVLDIVPPAELRLDGTKITATADEINALSGLELDADAINLLVQGVAAGYKVARGQHTTVAASDDVNTGLATVVAALATLDDDPSTATLFISCSIGNQSGAPAAGHILIKSWKPTAVNDVTPTAATAFTKKVNWIAIGT